MPEVASPRPATNQTRNIQQSNVMMGDVNGDGGVNVIDVVAMINHLNGNYDLSGDRLTASKLTGGNSVTVLDVVLLINYLNGNAVLPSSGYTVGVLTNDTKIRLSSGGTEFSSVSNGSEVRILSLASNQVEGVYWDLVVTSKGLYGYIDRNSYK